MLKIGDTAPEFSLPDQHGQQQSLQDLVEKKGLILYFYPADFTPVCTRQACLLRDIHEELANEGLNVAGISPQDENSHEKFSDKFRLPFSILADSGKTTIRDYGCLLPIGLGVRRRTFLIDDKLRIRDILTADFIASRHQKFARNARRLLGENQD